jgi:glycosyltransferase involved in cell wall biosynthesis
MKILLVTGSFPPMRCGVGDYTERLVNELAARGDIEVGVLTSEAAARLEPPGRFQLFAIVQRWRFRELPKILALVKRWAPDIVHVQTPTQGYENSWVPRVLPLLCRLGGYRVVQSWHEYIGRLGPRQLMWLLIQAPVSGGLVVVRPDYDEATRGLQRLALTGKIRRFIPNASVIPKIELSESERAAIRKELAAPGMRILVYFGFMHPAKGVEQVFQVADPQRDHIVVIGEFRDTDAYHLHINSIVCSETWRGRTTLTGFLPVAQVARLIAAADAVVLPFTAGGGEWNTSIHGAQAQGTLVLTTSQQHQGYREAENTYYARPGDLDEMRAALDRYVGHRNPDAGAAATDWKTICDAHLDLYRLTAMQ